MDPLTAFSLAGTIIQFIDFSSKIFGGARHVYKSASGELSANEEMRLITLDIQAVVSKLKFRAQPNTKSTSIGSDPIGDSLCYLCDQVELVAEELIGRLEQLQVEDGVKGPRRVWESLNQVIKSAWKREELKAMMEKLGALKQMLDNVFMMEFREQFDRVAMSISERFNNLDQQTTGIVSALLEDRHAGSQRSKDSKEQTAALALLISRLEDSNTAEHRKTRQMIAGLHANPKGSSQWITPNVETLGVPQEEECLLRKEVGNAVLQSLGFASMNDRYEEVAQAYKLTFDWVFNDSEEALRPWANFVEWLGNRDGLYWLKGKAGSGKSTLMKYIYDDPRTRELLRRWRPGVPLIIASHFFWINGDREQKSQQGLLRTLLYEILNQKPELIPVVLPSTWARTYSGNTRHEAGVFQEKWTLQKLTEGLQRLLHQNIFPLKLCFFIDGLDEFAGDHEAVTELFKQFAASSSDVKFCISSRPWVVFEEGFTDFPCLRLQDLTKSDISHYVHKSLESSPAFQRLAVKNHASAWAFAGEIVERAAGVFVWVILAVRSLSNGIRNRDAIEDLHRRLLSLPQELEPLYQRLVDLIEPEYLVWTSKTFQIMECSQSLRSKGFFDEFDNTGQLRDEDTAYLSLIGLCLAHEEDLSIQEAMSWTPDVVSERCEVTEIRLTARCAGMLEVWQTESSHPKLRQVAPRSRIHYLHRTAQEFLKQDEVWRKILLYTSHTKFEPGVSLFRSFTLLIGITPRPRSDVMDMKEVYQFARHALCIAHSLDHDSQNPPAEILKQLDTALACKRNFENHWSPSTNRRGLSPVTTVLPITIMLGMCSLYTESRRKEGSCSRRGNGIPTMPSTPTVPLLHYAVPRDYQHRYHPVPDPRIVKLLLVDGECPNAVHNGITPWQQALVYARGQKNRNDMWHERLKLLQIITLMLKAGADSRATVPMFSEATYSVGNLLAEIANESSRLGCRIGDTEDAIVDDFLATARHAIESSSVRSLNSTVVPSSTSILILSPTPTSISSPSPTPITSSNPSPITSPDQTSSVGIITSTRLQVLEFKPSKRIRVRSWIERLIS